ncbi:MAG: efflux RND transporter permease subunit, partial [Burkholderiaceae bacterium]
AMGMIKQATANPLVLSEALREQLPRIERELPEGVKVTIAYDSSVFIDRSINAVMLTILEAIIFVAVIIFLFLGRARASLIPLVTIPISLVSAFTIMSLAGFSINTLTLLSMVVAIGLVVDDAIVVMENSYRHIERGMKPLQAAFKAINEVGFAVVAMTLTLAAVFAPLVFVPGRIGRLFTEFALTLAGVVVVSGFVALTLSPMMCSKLLRNDAPPRWFLRSVDRFMRALTRWYTSFLGTILKFRWLVMVALVASLLGTVYSWTTTKSELAPIEDRGVFMTFMGAPEGSSLAYTSESGQAIEKLALETPDVFRIFMIAGNPTPNQGLAFIGLNDWNDRTRSVKEVIGEFAGKLGSVPGVFAFPNQPQSFGASSRDRPVTVVIQSSDSYEEIQRVVDKVIADFNRSGLMSRVDSDLKLNKPEIRVKVDRERAADAGVAVNEIGRTLETMLGGRSVTTFKQNNEEYNVVLQLEDDARKSPKIIDTLFVRGRSGAMVPLSALVTVEEGIGARELNHFGQRRAVTISANLTPGSTQGEVLEYVQRVMPGFLPAGYGFDYNGSLREFSENSYAMLLAVGMALGFIFLVLSAQFESFVDPLVILTTVPAAILGGLLLLKTGGGTLNIYSQIGLITLVGLITKHGILIVEFANQCVMTAPRFVMRSLKPAACACDQY